MAYLATLVLHAFFPRPMVDPEDEEYDVSKVKVSGLLRKDNLDDKEEDSNSKELGLEDGGVVTTFTENAMSVTAARTTTMKIAPCPRTVTTGSRREYHAHRFFSVTSPTVSLSALVFFLAPRQLPTASLCLVSTTN